MNTLSPRIINRFILGGLLYAYFVVFPGDLQILFNPLQAVLRLTEAGSPWLLGLAAVAVLSWTALRIWGRDRRQKFNPHFQRPARKPNP